MERQKNEMNKLHDNMRKAKKETLTEDTEKWMNINIRRNENKNGRNINRKYK